MTIIIVSNIVFLILLLTILFKMIKARKILFGSNKEFALLQKRYNIKEGSMPTPSDSFMIYVTILLSMIYIGSIVQAKLVFTGLAITQLFLAVIPLLCGYYLKTDFKKTFSLYKPRGRHVVGAVIFWIGLFFVSNGLANLLMPLSPYNKEVNEQLSAALIHDNLWINLLVVAVLPAICEELLFRGIIYKGIENNGKSMKRAIILSGILFGFMHMDFIRMIPTALLGIGFAYVLYRSRSIFLCMLMHFLNNGFIVIVQHFVKTTVEAPELIGNELMIISITYIIIGLVPLLVGNRLLSTTKSK